MRERWYLYGNDVDLALELLRRDLRAASSLEEQAWLVRFLPNLGRHEEAAHWLRQQRPELLNTMHGRATWMRVLQHRGERNPWLALQPAGEAEAFQRYGDALLMGTYPFDLWLGGGLGDQLECMAMLQAALAQHPLLQRLRLVLPQGSRRALEPLLESWWPPNLPSYRFEAGPPRSLEQRPWLSMIPFQAVLAGAGLLVQPTSVAPQAGAPSAEGHALLCCWRCKVDPHEKLWAHLRSLPFALLLRLYEQLVPWAQAAGLFLQDISRYRTEEAAALERFAPTLQLLEPSLRSFADTAQLLLSSRAVITVDTALVHLARWFHWPSLLVLHRHPDERWQPQLQTQAPTDPIRILRQVHYNQWADLPARLLRELEHWLSPEG